MLSHCLRSDLFLFNGPAPTEIYTLSLHDALPISRSGCGRLIPSWEGTYAPMRTAPRTIVRLRRSTSSGVKRDRKSTRLNSSHRCISYAVFCLKKKKRKQTRRYRGYTEAHTKTAST